MGDNAYRAGELYAMLERSLSRSECDSHLLAEIRENVSESRKYPDDPYHRALIAGYDTKSDEITKYDADEEACK